MYFNCILFLTDEIVTCHTVESFYRFYDKNDHENTIFPIQSRFRLRTRKCDTSFYYEFQRECRGGENKLSNVRNFII